MIWATLSSRSCFCWLYRASASLAAKNIIDLILVLTVWWWPCVESSLGCRKGCLLWPMCSFDKTLLAFVLLNLYFKGKLICFSRYLFTSYFCIPIPYVENDILLLLLLSVLEGLIGLNRTDQLQLLQHQWLRHRLGLLWWWMICLGNEPRSFCRFWDCTQVLHFTLILTMRVTPFLLRDSCPEQ